MVGLTDLGAHGRFDVWAPVAGRVRLSVVADGAERVLDMLRGDDGWWTPAEPVLGAEVDYGYLVDDDETPKPDPRSQWQPHGVHARSRT